MELLKKLALQAKEAFLKLSTAKKAIVAGVVLALFVAFGIMISVSGSEQKVVLFAQLESKEFGEVSKKLEEMGYKYSTTGTTGILVSPQERDIILTRLAQEDLIPKGVPGWQLFDMSKWTETDREIDVKYMRALTGELKRHLESLKNIEKADVQVAMSDESLYSNETAKYTAAVTVYLSAGYEKLTRKEVKGIVTLVSRGVGPKLKPEDVVVTDENGSIISDFDDDGDAAKLEISLLEQRKKLEEKERVKMLRDIQEGLKRIFSEDRIQVVRLNLEYNWDKVNEQRKEYLPFVLRQDNPDTPYSELEVKESTPISRKNTTENFQGHGWNPQGPAGTDSNRPPGYKAADDQFAKYDKQENIENLAVGQSDKTIQRQPYEVAKVSVSIAIDGVQDLPKNPDGSYDLDPAKKPVQTPLTPEELKQAEDLIKSAVGFNRARGDMVSVKNIMFDRSKQWEALRDEYERKEQFKRLLLAVLIGIFALFLGFILFTAIKKEMARRRRIREEQLALEQQRMREAALRAAEEDGVDVELSLEEKARLELQENAIRLAKERPNDVAQLLRTWLAEE
ncbi:MAG TPA: flagellar basal-body MS-ring/collar protein FliF [Spirochaetota bacterium]|jgi:flagellar M-ring protein FliF|nr:flagellar basal-body MS-ring/collar protein FliF [Spirochaetota bacterium]HOR45171.1 flagellar basal-body MS-ring/collar protein FliF [Spirochaetota bacterium]HOU85716.1 flagellar basal-body MS-ring/collar protein FliF [Spirochaetota bacterium]HPK56646.1 flagellar basal-body MS-ring/collar protein FliF [Spirochaetota bacterium]HQE57877.1 flagellar basal-body MS-ring/collar protein FliF [Spirochaetota bacterium]